ncbi:MAG: HAD family hydrolase [Tepidisphaerales bacterium]
MLKAILFDLGDTLFDTRPMRLWQVFEEGGRDAYTYLTGLGYKLPPFPRYFAMHKRAVQAWFVWSRVVGGEVNCERILRRIAVRLGLDLGEEVFREMTWLWYSPTVRHNQVAPDVIPMLTRFRDRGLKLAIVSNTFVPAFVLDRHLEIENLLQFFPHRVYSSELNLRKPDRRVFEQALRLVGVEPGEAIFVGDNIRNDILGARRAGMLAILKRPASETRTHRVADHLVRTMRELEQILPLLGAPTDFELSAAPGLACGA